MNFRPLDEVTAELVDHFALNYSEAKERINSVAIKATRKAGHLVLRLVKCTQTVENYRADMPEGVEILKWIEYNGMNLRKVGDYNNDRSCPFTACNYANYSQHTGYIQTSFECGEVTFYYYEVPRDEKGFLEVYDDADWFDALNYFIIWHLILAGANHRFYKDPDVVEGKWLIQRQVAMNSIKQKDFSATYEQLMRLMTRPAYNKNMSDRQFHRQ